MDCKVDWKRAEKLSPEVCDQWHEVQPEASHEWYTLGTTYSTVSCDDSGLDDRTECTTSKFADDKNSEEWLIDLIGVLPRRGTLTGYRNELRGKPLSSAREMQSPAPGDEHSPAQAGGHPAAGKQLWGKGPGGSTNWDRILSKVQSQDERQQAQTEIQQIAFKHSEVLYWECGWALAQVVQRGCRVSNLGDIKNPRGHSSRLTVLWGGGWTRWSPQAPFNISDWAMFWKYVQTS